MGAAKPNEGRVTVLDSLAFLCELAMLVILAVSGWRIGSGLALQVILAVLFPLVAAGVWTTWMAPGAQRRLANPGRLAAQIALFVIAAIIGIGAGLVPVAVVFVIVSAVVFGLGSRRER
ncbi:YrdB family protein [Rhodococcus sp. D2-41]|uniref:YrdB family protein n=1 Tax=Speluncibacter jeojiensis TaxID=2710754 RepID=A0A9X4M6I8_9ACTN|nr:YrdB family protein [Rhodococcus sp. D2-41]MDG3012714.1 YrdB family protein [Rhodococcus sp. D2-41]MDG3015391.1 YrdB family protein [Corynebacteriales bacterium D3-21]